MKGEAYWTRVMDLEPEPPKIESAYPVWCQGITGSSPDRYTGTMTASGGKGLASAARRRMASEATLSSWPVEPVVSSVRWGRSSGPLRDNPKAGSSGSAAEPYGEHQVEGPVRQVGRTRPATSAAGVVACQVVGTDHALVDPERPYQTVYPGLPARHRLGEKIDQFLLVSVRSRRAATRSRSNRNGTVAHPRCRSRPGCRSSPPASAPWAVTSRSRLRIPSGRSSGAGLGRDRRAWHRPATAWP